MCFLAYFDQKNFFKENFSIWYNSISDFWPKTNANLKFGFLKFIYSEKATKFCKIFTFLLSYVHSASQK